MKIMNSLPFKFWQETVLRRADLALFEAKEHGRNRILCQDEI